MGIGRYVYYYMVCAVLKCQGKKIQVLKDCHKTYENFVRKKKIINTEVHLITIPLRCGAVL